MKAHYEVVVIGSGYGGSIAASRFSRAGMEVCLLEKGKEFLPGDFPKSLTEAMKEMQLKKASTEIITQISSENGLYDFTLGDEISVLKGCGLGGTSLINANVSIEADPRIFEDARWPTEIRNDLASVKEGIEKARAVLKPNPYPENQKGYPVLAKTEAMRKSAKAMGESCKLLDINVSFEDHINDAGVNQPKCTNCGDCVTGCNRGAKNTTAMNYLPDAFNHGASIFTSCGVNYIEQKNGKWVIYFTDFGSGREKFKAPELFVTADQLILSAGSLGSTEILLRSAEKGLDLSGMLGQNFTGNGDVLGFGYNNDQPIDGVGKPEAAFDDKIIEVGPCITSVIDTRANATLEDGMTIEEGVIPGAISSIVNPALLALSKVIGKDTDGGFMDEIQEAGRELKSAFGGSYAGAMDNTQTFLVMSNDDGNGKIALDKDELIINWKDLGKQKIFEKVNHKLLEATAALGGTFLKNPTWTKMLDYDLVTVHPLGGCAMGDNAETAVVNHKGQVFKGKNGTDLYQGLYVMDGAVLPRPLGTNPLLTISGLSERNVKLILEDLGKTPSTGRGTVVAGTQVREPGIQFTETMRGYFSKDVQDDYQKGYDQGKASNSPFEFTLTIQSQDVKKLIEEPTHQAALYGTMTAPALSATPFRTYNGTFNLFRQDPEKPAHKRMDYTANLMNHAGEKFYFEGFKDVHDDKGFDLWQDTTTLYITLYKGENKGENNKGKIVGKGKLLIEIPDFARQMTTMKALNTQNGKTIVPIAEFGKFFAGEIFDSYLIRKGFENLLG